MADEGEASLTQMLRVMLQFDDRQRREEQLAEERQRRDEQLAEERRVREEERRVREDELRAERTRWDEEAARQEEEVQRQMELLQGLVVGILKQGEDAAVRAEKDRDVRVAKLT